MITTTAVAGFTITMAAGTLKIAVLDVFIVQVITAAVNSVFVPLTHLYFTLENGMNFFVRGAIDRPKSNI